MVFDVERRGGGEPCAPRAGGPLVVRIADSDPALHDGVSVPLGYGCVDVCGVVVAGAVS